MEIRFNNYNCIITPLSPELGKRETDKIRAEIIQYANYKIGLDLSFVQNCSFDFLNFVFKCGNINIFNIPSNIFVLINCMNIDKSVNLFVSENDFLCSSRRLLNRKLSIVE